MKVVFATNHTYPPQCVGGSESSIHCLCLALRERDVEVGVLCNWSVRQPWASTFLLRSLRNPGRRLLRDEFKGYPIYRARASSQVNAVTELVGDFAPDVAVVGAGKPIMLAERFLELGIPTVVYIRDAIFEQLGGAVKSAPLLRYVTTSNALARRFEETFGILPERIPPIIQPDLYRVTSARKNVTFVCPVPGKGLETALQLAARRPDIPFEFVEGWPVKTFERINRYSRIRRYSNVVLRDRTQDMRTVYRDAKVILVPSPEFEGWGRVVSEAQVSGIPALASTIGGLPEAVGPGGILIDPDAGIDAWAAALSRLWDDPDEYDRLAERALQHARRPEFEPAALASRLLAVISELRTGAGPF